MANPHPNMSGLQPGRKKGQQNIVTRTFKQALLDAFHKIGGMEAMAEWGAKEKNRAVFYQICARLVPTEVAGSKDAEPILTKVIHEYREKP